MLVIYVCPFLSVYLLESAISVSDGVFAWERDAEPLLKKYVYSINYKVILLHVAMASICVMANNKF